MSMTTLTFDPRSTAVILIDLQRGIVGRPTAPASGAEVVRRSRELADKFRERGATIIFSRVLLGELANLPVDEPSRPPGSPPAPPEAIELIPEAGFQAGDLLISKRQWGAFYGTELEQQLRRRRITTIILGGVATNFGVESTGRFAAESGYAVIFAEDLMASVSAEAHTFATKTIFPRIGRVRTSEQILAGLQT